MILLNGHTLQPKDRFRVESMPLNLEERNSTATITIGPDAPSIDINDWLKDETEPGAGIIWRVKTISESVETRTRTITLEHVIQYLKDYVVFGEVTPATVTGNSSAERIRGRQMAEYVMANQQIWILGDFETDAGGAYSFNGDTVYDALETITDTGADLQWEYDLTRIPFVLHIRRHPQGVQSEMRMDRNITTMKRQIDRSRMYTRIYPIGKDNLTITGDYLSKNENIWGCVAKVETNQDYETENALKTWAMDLLERHCEPLVTITISGMELSSATGEPLDHIIPCTRCRVPLPDYGTTVLERVTKMSWADKIKEPRKVTVTLANQLEDVSSILSSLSSSSASSSRSSAKNAGKDHAWMEDADDHISLIAEAIIGTDENGVDWSRVSEIRVDGKGIHETVKKCQGDILVAQAQIDLNEDRILQEVIDRSAKDRELSGKITVEAGKITQIVQSVGADGEVTAASICLAINSSNESSATINASKIYLLGQTIANRITADYIDAKISELSMLHGISAYFSGSLRVGSSIYFGTNASDVSKNLITAIRQLQITQSGNTYKLQKMSYNDNDWADVGSFSRAVSSWSVGGGSGKVNVTANPQGQTKSVPVSVGGPNSITANGTYTYRAYYENADGDDVETGASETVTVNVPTDSIDNIDLNSVQVSTGQPSQASNPTQLTTLANAIKNNRNTYVWFRVQARKGTTSKLDKWYYCASA